MTEITLPSGVYRVGKLTPKQQLHIARRIAPLAIQFKGTEEEIGIAFTEHVAKMSDADVDAIIDPSLAVCQKKIADGVWAPVVSSSNAIMFDNIQAKEIFELTIAVLKENLGNFFPGQGAAGALASAVKTGQN